MKRWNYNVGYAVMAMNLGLAAYNASIGHYHPAWLWCLVALGMWAVAHLRHKLDDAREELNTCADTLLATMKQVEALKRENLFLERRMQVMREDFERRA